MDTHYTTLQNYNIDAHDICSYHDSNFDPDTRQIPTQICNHLDIPFGTLTDRKLPPFSKMRRCISGNFWILVNAMEFNGLTTGEVYLILNNLPTDREDIIVLLNKNEGVWNRLRKRFEQSHPNIDINSDKEYIVLRKWLKENMIKCFNTFYNLCHDRELSVTHSTDMLIESEVCA